MGLEFTIADIVTKYAYWRSKIDSNQANVKIYANMLTHDLVNKYAGLKGFIENILEDANLNTKQKDYVLGFKKNLKKLSKASNKSVSYLKRMPIVDKQGYESTIINPIKPATKLYASLEFLTQFNSVIEHIKELDEGNCDIDAVEYLGSKMDSGLIRIKDSVNDFFGNSKPPFDIYLGLEHLVNERKNILKLNDILVHNNLNDIRECDYNVVSQVLMPLLNNAIDHSRAKNLYFNYDSNVNGIVFNVVDDGVGIPFDNPNVIFQPDVSSRSTDKDPHGLGLSVVKETVVNDYSGQIYVENNATGGATFTLKIPSKK